MDPVPKSDILAALPVWVQIAANLGMFAVSVVVSAWGFAKRLGNDMAPQLPISDHHFEEGGPLHDVGGMFRDLIIAQQRIAKAMEDNLERQRRRDEEDRVEAEVQRRLKEQRAQHVHNP